MKSFIKRNPEYDINVTLLLAERIMELAKRYPELYGDIPVRNLIRVDYVAEKEILSVIYDFNERKILKTFRKVTIS